jgi:hypothetical protein
MSKAKKAFETVKAVINGKPVTIAKIELKRSPK